MFCCNYNCCPIRLQLLSLTGSRLLMNNNIHKDCATYNAASPPHWFHAYLRITIFINVAQLLYNFLEQIVQRCVLLEGDSLLCHLCSRYRTCVAIFLALTLPASTANVQLARNSQRAIAVASLGQCEDATSHHYMLIAFSMVELVASSMIPRTSYPCR